MNKFTSRWSRALATFVSLALTLETLFFCIDYYQAVRYLQEHDPRQNANMTGTIVYAHPMQVFVGQPISRQEVIDHLQSIGFNSGEKREPGTFLVSGDSLRINSRLREMPNLDLIFGKGRITSVVSDGVEVSTAQVEPETLASFVRLIKDNQSYPMWIRRYPLQASDLIPSPLYDAVRSSEDKRFESHNGLDYMNLAKAMLEHRGGSTITQQMVKNAILQDQSRTLTRKWSELTLTLAVERRYTKEEIFSTYANNVYCGRIPGGPVLYGLAALSEEVFGTKDISALGPGRAATLAGMLNRPEKYLLDARNKDYEAVRARRDRVLDLMARNYPDRYPAEVIEREKAEAVTFAFTSQRQEANKLDLITRHFQQFAADNLNLIGLQKSEFESGLHLYTTIDTDLQQAAQAAIDKEMPRLDALFARSRAGRSRKKGEGLLEAAIVALDPRDGRIVAMTGGRDFNESQYNCALALRSPGSTLKPFLYALALSHGQHNGPFNPATVVDPTADAVADGFRPAHHVGGRARARVQLARSDNGAATVVLNIAGMDLVRGFIYELTGSMPERSGMMAIGGGAGTELSPLSLARAYAIFPSNGLLPSLTPFAAAYKDGEPMGLNETLPVRVMEPGPAFLTTQMCRSVVGVGHDGAAGTAKNALTLADISKDVDVAGKTGTGQISDVWFVGFTRRLVVVVWIGHTVNAPLTMSAGFSGGKAAVPLWANFMRSVAKYRPDLLAEHFQQPENIHTRSVDPVRGCLRVDGALEEYFMNGREPTRCDESVAGGK
jgi:membrane peptidoglycan carboxypeptidase